MQYFIVENSLVDNLDDWPAHLDILFDLFRHFVVIIWLLWVTHGSSALKLKTKIYVGWTAGIRQMLHFSFIKVYGNFCFKKKEICTKRKPAWGRKLFYLFVNKFIPAYVVLGNVSIMLFLLLSGHFQRWSRYN